jgi:sulfur relay (sulfurtransferase) DsrC/TusE family protein
MKDLAAILFVAVILSAAIYMIYKENSEKYFNDKYKQRRLFRDPGRPVQKATKVVGNKRKRGYDTGKE